MLKGAGKLTLHLGNDPRSAKIGDNGEATFPGIPAQQRGAAVTAVLDAPQHELADRKAGLKLDGEALYLAVAVKRKVLAGTVHDTNGRPIANAGLEVMDGRDGKVTSAASDSGGNFRLELPGDLPDTARGVTVHADGYQDQRHRFEFDSGAWAVRLDKVKAK